MNNKKGKIIAIVGPPRSGKTFFSDLLARHYKGKVILQGEEKDFPKRITEDIEKNIRPLERILWFRNMLVRKYLLALKHKNKGSVVILDTFWMSYQLHIDALVGGFRRDVIRELAEIDRKLLSYPDIIIFLKVSEKTIRKFIKLGGRKFDNSEEFIVKQALPISKLHENFFKKNRILADKVVIVERDSMDFEKKVDFQKIIRLIERKLL